MKVLEFLCKEAVAVDMKAAAKREALVELVELLKQAGKIADAEEAVRVLMEREQLGSTGIGQGIAIPHGKVKDITDMVVACGISRRGVAFDALDGEPVHLIFLLLAPDGSAGQHLKVLAKIARLLKDKFFRQSLREAKTPDEVLATIQEEDTY